MTDPFATQGPQPAAPGAPDQPPAAPQAPQAPGVPPMQPNVPGQQTTEHQLPLPPNAPAPAAQDFGATQVFPGLEQPPPSYVAETPEAHNHAGFGGRLLAWILDRVIMTVLLLVISAPVILWMVANFETEIGLCANGIDTCEQPTDDTTARLIIGIGIIALAAVLVSLLYQITGLARRGQTIGRRIMKIRVIKELTGQPPGWGGAFIRVLVGGISGQIFYLGHLWRLWDDKKQTWHDKAAGTIVVQE